MSESVWTQPHSTEDVGDFVAAVRRLEGRTQTATLLVEQKYQDFEQATAYATSFLLAAVSVACIIAVSFLRPETKARR